MISSKEIHQNAIDHGWWDKPRSFDTVVCLIHSEISEALEDYRNKNMTLSIKNKKPCGFGSELADIAIRLHDLSEALEQRNSKLSGIEPIPDMLCLLHSVISSIYDQGSDSKPLISYALDILKSIANESHINLEEMIKIKHEYNKTRPYRHGNKKC